MKNIKRQKKFQILKSEKKNQKRKGKKNKKKN